MTRTLLASAAIAGLALTPACAQDSSAQNAALDRAAVEEIVRAYILENPEIIEDALIALAGKQEAEKAAAAKAALDERADEIFNDPRDFSIGPADAELTVVEFFDYRCGYCKASLDWVQSLPETHDGKVRVVFKEFPILSPESEQAALAALAAGEQGKYVEMHTALMKSRSKYKDADIDAIAQEAGVDVAKMRADMKSTEVRQQLADVRNLAQTLGTRSTPTFIVDGEIIPGFDKARLETLVSEAVG